MRRRTLLLVNHTKPEAIAAAANVRKLIEQHGTLVAELEADSDESPLRLEGKLDLIVVLGGDGTLLAQARRCVGLRVPLLGINLGKLGFMAEFDAAAFAAQAKGLLSDAPLLTRDLDLVRVEVRPQKAEKPRFSALGLNEAVVTSGPPYRMIELGLRLDGVDGPHIIGDGLIVSTPTGSTAYNLSAGGPIISPLVDAMVVTPIAAHSLAFRPIVIPGHAKVELTVIRSNDEDHGHGGTTLVLDGHIQEPLSAGDVVSIVLSDVPVTFVRNPKGDYWRTLVEKLHWAAAPRTRS